MNKIYTLLLVLVIACSSGELKLNEHLTIEDLRFPDFERELVRQNKIRSTYFLARNPYLKWQFGNFFNSWDTIPYLNWKYDTIGVIRYDTLGRTIFTDRERYGIFTYKHDTLGVLTDRVKKEYDSHFRYTCRYTFHPDSLILKQYWSYAGYHYKNIFFFNSSGEVIREFNDDFYNNGGVTRKIYEYDGGRLMSEVETLDSAGKVILRRITKIYYSLSYKVDSAVSFIESETHGKYLKGKYKQVSYYDSAGLKQKSVLADTLVILFRHSGEL